MHRATFLLAVFKSHELISAFEGPVEGRSYWQMLPEQSVNAHLHETLQGISQAEDHRHGLGHTAGVPRLI